VTSSASAGAAAAAGFSPDNPTLAGRITGMLVRPVATLEGVRRDGRWRGVLVATTAAALVVGVLVMQTAAGQQALVDQWERTTAALGQEVDAAGYAQLEELSRYGWLYSAAGTLLAGPLLALGVTALLQAVFGRNRPVPFARAWALVVHAGVVLALRQVIFALLAYARETTASAVSLGVWFPGLDASSALSRALGFVDLFVVWWIVLLGIAAAMLYGRRRRNLVCAFLGLYLALALVAAAAFAAAGGAA
jgi:energy-converting hydrogenase Eha subunit A